MASIRSAPRRQISSRARTNSWRASSVAATLSIGVPPFAGVTTPVSPINDRPKGTPRPSPGPASTTFVHTSLIFSKDPDGLTTSGAFLALPRTRARHVLQFVGPDPDVAEPLAWPERRPALDRLTGRALVVLAEREPWVELRRRFRAEPLPAAPTSLLPIHELQGLVTDHVAHAPKLAWLEGGSRRHRCPRRRGPRRSARSNVTTVVPGTVESFLPGTRRGGRSAHLAPRDTRLPGQKSFPSTT